MERSEEVIGLTAWTGLFYVLSENTTTTSSKNVQQVLFSFGEPNAIGSFSISLGLARIIKKISCFG